MAVNMFASIYIGSYEVSLKVFEISQRKKIKEIDCIRARINLGKDAYYNGYIGYELVEELCELLFEYKKVMQSYQIDKYEIYASAVLRDISNDLFILDQIQLRTGFKVKVISNSEVRFIGYKSVAGSENFEEMIKTSAAIVDIGGSSLQITLFKDGKLCTTQHLKLGTMRLRNLLYDPGLTDRMYRSRIEEYIDKRLEMFRSLYLEEGVDYAIFMNDYGADLIRRVDREDTIRADKFMKYMDKFQKKSLLEISEELGLGNDKDPLVVPSLMLLKGLVSNLNAETVCIPGVNINDGIAYDYAERNRLITVTHDFDKDIISAAQRLSEHYHSFTPHIEALSLVSTKIFNVMKKVHGMGKREKLLLQIATILHDCGKYISFSESPNNAYNIIMSSEIIGLSHREREIVALTVLYNTLPIDSYDNLQSKIDKQGYITVAKLSAILRVANALDQSHKQKFKNIRISLKERELNIIVETLEDISLEQALFENKTAYFEKVFSIKPVLKEKRVFI